MTDEKKEKSKKKKDNICYGKLNNTSNKLEAFLIDRIKSSFNAINRDGDYPVPTVKVLRLGLMRFKFISGSMVYNIKDRKNYYMNHASDRSSRNNMVSETAYIRILNAASEGIEQNLLKRGMRSLNCHDLNCIYRMIPLVKKIFMSESSLNNYIKRSLSTYKAIIPTFTFVRDPLARFKSGFAEAIFQALPIFQLNSTNVKNILQDFFALDDPLNRGTLLASERFLHTMSGSLFEFDIDAIGTFLLLCVVILYRILF